MAFVSGQSSSVFHRELTLVQSLNTGNQTQNRSIHLTNTANSHLDLSSSASKSLPAMSSWMTALFTRSSSPTFHVPSFQSGGLTISAACQLCATVALTVVVQPTRMKTPAPRSRDTTPSSPAERQHRCTSSPAKRTSPLSSTASSPRSRRLPSLLIHRRSRSSITSTLHPTSLSATAPSQPA